MDVAEMDLHHQLHYLPNRILIMVWILWIPATVTTSPVTQNPSVIRPVHRRITNAIFDHCQEHKLEDRNPITAAGSNYKLFRSRNQYWYTNINKRCSHRYPSNGNNGILVGPVEFNSKWTNWSWRNLDHIQLIYGFNRNWMPEWIWSIQLMVNYITSSRTH